MDTQALRALTLIFLALLASYGLGGMRSMGATALVLMLIQLFSKR